MTTGTTSIYGEMIEIGRDPGQGSVAIITLSRGLHMIDWLAWCIGAVMATRACARNTAMVKIDRCPIIGYMAIITNIAGL